MLPIRWEECDFDAKLEIGLLSSVLHDHFNFKFEKDLVLQSNDGAQSQLEIRFAKYIDPKSGNALASQDLLVVIYNGHSADGVYHNSNMILRKLATPEARYHDRHLAVPARTMAAGTRSQRR